MKGAGDLRDDSVDESELDALLSQGLQGFSAEFAVREKPAQGFPAIFEGEFAGKVLLKSLA